VSIICIAKQRNRRDCNFFSLYTSDPSRCCCRLRTRHRWSPARRLPDLLSAMAMAQPTRPPPTMMASKCDRVEMNRRRELMIRTRKRETKNLAKQATRDRHATLAHADQARSLDGSNTSCVRPPYACNVTVVGKMKQRQELMSSTPSRRIKVPSHESYVYR
jgi:hypothetical protein